MHAVNLVHDMPVSQDKVWEAWADFGGIAEFHPGLKRSPIIRGPESGIGSTRSCEQHDGVAIEEKITVFEPQSKISWKLETPPKPLKAGDVTVRLESIGSDKTRVFMDFDIQMGMGPLGSVIFQLFAKRVIRKNLTKVLAGLEAYITR